MRRPDDGRYGGGARSSDHVHRKRHLVPDWRAGILFLAAAAFSLPGFVPSPVLAQQEEEEEGVPAPAAVSEPSPADLTPEEALESGIALAETGSYADAIAHLERAVAGFEEKGKTAEGAAGSAGPLRAAHSALGASLAAVGRYEDAEKSLRAAVGLDPSDRAADLSLAELLVSRGRDAEAEAIFVKRLGAPESPDFRAHHGLSSLRESRGKRAEAEALRMAVARFAEENLIEDPERLYYLGLVYARLDRFDNHAQMAIDVLTDLEKADSSFVPGYVAQGRVFLDKYQDKDAIDQFKKALSRNANHADAMVGLAEAYLVRFDNSQARSYVERALATHPGHVGALVLRAYFAFDDHDYAGAREFVDRALAVNPRSREALAYSAAQAHVSHDTKGYEAAIAEALSLDPKFGEAYYIVAEVLALNRRFEESRLLCLKALEIDDRLWKAYTSLAKYCFHTGREDEGQKALEHAQKNDPYDHIWRQNMIVVAGKLESFMTTETERFRLRIHVSENAVMRRYVLDVLDRAWDALSAKYKFTPEGPIVVEMFSDREDFAVRTLGFPGIDGVLGACFGKVMTLRSPKSMPQGTFAWSRTVWHEFAHVISLQLSKSRVPRWLTEGLSTYEEGEARSEWERDMDYDLLNALANGDLIPMKDLNAAFMTGLIGFAYYQSGVICEFIEKTWGFDRIIEMLKLYGEDKDTPEILKTLFGLSETEFDARFEAYVRERLKDVRIRPAYTYETVQERRQSLRTRRDDRGPEAIADLKVVATGYLTGGKSSDAGPYLVRLAKAAPSDPETWFLHAEFASQRGLDADAIRHLEKGFELGGSEFFAHHLRGKLALRGDASLTPEPAKAPAAGEEGVAPVTPLAPSVFPPGADLDRALAEFRKAKACFPRYVGPQDPPHLIAQILLTKGQRDEAMQELYEFTRVHHTDLPDRMTLADWRLEKGDLLGAEALLLEANAIDPFERDVHLRLADAYRKMGQNEKAVPELETAIELTTEKDDPTEADVRALLAEAFLALSRYAEARDEANAALSKDPDNEAAQALLRKLP